MAWAPGVLASGQLASSKGTILNLTTPCVVRGIQLANASTSPMTVYLHLLRNGGSSRFLVNGAVLLVGETLLYDTPIPMTADDNLEGYASSATSVDYSIFGVSRV